MAEQVILLVQVVFKYVELLLGGGVIKAVGEVFYLQEAEIALWIRLIFIIYLHVVLVDLKEWNWSSDVVIFFHRPVFTLML